MTATIVENKEKVYVIKPTPLNKYYAKKAIKSYGCHLNTWENLILFLPAVLLVIIRQKEEKAVFLIVL